MKFKEFERELTRKDLKVFRIGRSTLGKEIYACHVGNEYGSQVLVQAGIHAREYVTSLLAARQAAQLLKRTPNYGVYFVLCSNPDGVEVVLEGFSSLKQRERDFCERKNFDHRLFKANANLVDLNTNFDALWGKGKANVTYPNFENHVGKFAESEIETRTLRRFTQIVRPTLTLSYHTKGEVVYYGFDTQNEESLHRDKLIGEKLARHLGFSLQRSFNSCGGYKDWVVQNYDVPSFTIEFGSDKLSHPLEEKYLPSLIENSQNIFEMLEEFVK